VEYRKTNRNRTIIFESKVYKLIIHFKTSMLKKVLIEEDRDAINYAMRSEFPPLTDPSKDFETYSDASVLKLKKARIKEKPDDSEVIKLTDYDLNIVECLSKGMSQTEISNDLKQKQWKPSGVSTIEKRLKFLKKYFKAKNPTHLVAITKDLGLI